MRPWHLKTHWKFLMPLDTLIPWNQKMIRHVEWWLDPQNLLQGEYLHPREHEKLIFTDTSNAGWGAHLGQNSTGPVVLGESPNGPVRNQPEQETSSLRLSDSRLSGFGSGCPQHTMEKPGCLRVPSHRPAAQGCTKTSISNVQDNSDCPRLANKTMVLGPSGDVSGHSKTTTTHTHPAQTTTEQPLPR